MKKKYQRKPEVVDAVQWLGHGDHPKENDRLKAENARLQSEVEKMKPTGTKEERQDRLVEIAQQMGFVKAEPAFWENDQPERPLENIEECANEAWDGEVHEVNLGLFLHDSVYTVCQEVDDDRETTVHDTEEAAEAAKKEKLR